MAEGLQNGKISKFIIPTDPIKPDPEEPVGVAKNEALPKTTDLIKIKVLPIETLTTEVNALQETEVLTPEILEAALAAETVLPVEEDEAAKPLPQDIIDEILNAITLQPPKPFLISYALLNEKFPNQEFQDPANPISESKKNFISSYYTKAINFITERFFSETENTSTAFEHLTLSQINPLQAQNFSNKVEKLIQDDALNQESYASKLAKLDDSLQNQIENLSNILYTTLTAQFKMLDEVSKGGEVTNLTAYTNSKTIISIKLIEGLRVVSKWITKPLSSIPLVGIIAKPLEFIFTKPLKNLLNQFYKVVAQKILYGLNLEFSSFLNNGNDEEDGYSKKAKELTEEIINIELPNLIQALQRKEQAPYIESLEKSYGTLSIFEKIIGSGVHLKDAIINSSLMNSIKHALHIQELPNNNEEIINALIQHFFQEAYVLGNDFVNNTSENFDIKLVGTSSIEVD